MKEKNILHGVFKIWYGVLISLIVLNIAGLVTIAYVPYFNIFFIALLFMNLIGLALMLFWTRNRFIQPTIALEKVMKNLFHKELHDSQNKKISFSTFNDLEEFVYAIKRIRDSISKEYSREALKKQAKLDALQSQINPHFLYNTLEAVRSQVLIEGLNDTAEMIESLSNFFRYSISGKNDIISFEDELKNLDNYIKIMQYRFVNRFSVISRIDFSDDTLMGFMLPKLLLQPIIENAMKHGLEPKIGTGVVVIRAVRSDHFVEIFIEDDGIGMDSSMTKCINEQIANSDPEDKTKDGVGIALINVNERIKMFFGVNRALSIMSSKGFGTTVSVKLPLVVNNA